MDDKVVFSRQRGKCLHIVCQIDSRCRGQIAARRDVRIDIVGVNVDAVALCFPAQLDIERQNADIECFDLLGR